MAQFHLVTVWRIDAPLQQVCTAIFGCMEWPHWWKGVEKVEELDPGDAHGLGSLRRFTWKGRLPYRLTFDIRVIRIVPLEVIEGRASGEVEGTGCWYFSQAGHITVVRYEWNVRTTRLWMNLLALVAKPVFIWNHNQLMQQGGEGLARLLNARLLSCAHG